MAARSVGFLVFILFTFVSPLSFAVEVVVGGTGFKNTAGERKWMTF